MESAVIRGITSFYLFLAIWQLLKIYAIFEKSDLSYTLPLAINLNLNFIWQKVGSKIVKAPGPLVNIPSTLELIPIGIPFQGQACHGFT